MNSIRRHLSTAAFATALACVGLAMPSSVDLQAQTGVTVHDAWVREPAGNRKETAVFAVIENKGASARALVSGTAEEAGKVELHEMKMNGSMMQMSPVKDIKVPANGKTELKPGGLHIMLFELKSQPKAGDTVHLMLKFDDGTTLAVAAPVRKVDGMR